MDHAAGADRILCAEVVGPPASGKTTFLTALTQAGRGLLATTNYRSVTRVPLFAASYLALAPFFGGAERALHTPKERLLMLRLQASPGILLRESSKGPSAVLFDQGPVWDLVMLRDGDTHRHRSPRYLQWWGRMAKAWSSRLDHVVFLDASEAILAQRLRARSKAHPLKDLRERELHLAASRERALYEAVLAELESMGGPRPLRFDTGRLSVSQMVQHTMAAFEAERVG
jgi:hypothetical protein